MIRIALVVIVSLALVSCGGGGEETPPTAAEPASASPSQSASKPSSAELLQAVSATVSGFTASDVRAIPIGATATYTSNATTAGGANVAVLVQASACDPFICRRLDPATYQTAEAQRSLKSTLPSAHIENPALRWEFGTVELASGKTGLFTYALSYLETKDASGGTSRISANAYRAWFHDGRSLITLDVFSRGGLSARSTADLERNMSKAEAEAAAKSVFGAVSADLMK